MSEYIKTKWNTGDVITADKLNHIEDGIANAGGGSKAIFLVNEVNETQTEGRWVGTTIAPNLTLEELASYLWYFQEGDSWVLAQILIPQSQTTEGKIIVQVAMPPAPGGSTGSLVAIPYDIATGEIVTEWSD